MNTERKQERDLRWEELQNILFRLRHAYHEFLGIPTLVILGFLLLAGATYSLDRLQVLPSLRSFLERRLFPEPQATADEMAVIAGSVITVTTITISILLLALQQAASTFSDQVIVQFLRRTGNQFYFGFFIGLSAYSLLVLSSVTSAFNPVISAAVTLVLIVLALYLVMALLYTTITQMQPEVIIQEIHDQTLAARRRQLPLVRKTRREPRPDLPVAVPVRSRRHGYITQLDLEKIAAAAGQVGRQVEVVLLASFGSFVAYQDHLARIQLDCERDVSALEEAIREAIRMEEQRDMEYDPAYGIEQFETVAWTSISTSKSNPEPGFLAIRSMRDVLARWLTEDGNAEQQELPIVYTDNVIPRTMDAFESLSVVAAESKQHQNIAEILRMVAVMYTRFPPDLQRRAGQLVLRSLTTLRSHFLTGELDETLTVLEATLRGSQAFELASAVQQAQKQMREQVGKL
jgi:uncharacterized membrane protein